MESEGSCFNIANGCREELGGRAEWTGYQGENKESCLESCMQIPEALGCEFRKGGNGYDCKAFSIPVSNQSSDFRLYDFEDISEFTCWSINRSKNCYMNSKHDILKYLLMILSNYNLRVSSMFAFHSLFTFHHR